MTDQTRVAPNPPSPFADADPAYRHLFPTPFLFPDPPAGVLAPTGCDRLAVVPEAVREAIPGGELPEGLCPVCVAVMRSEPFVDARVLAPCRECGAPTRPDGLCALCRQERHDAWWATRGEAGTEVAR